MRIEDIQTTEDRNHQCNPGKHHRRGYPIAAQRRRTKKRRRQRGGRKKRSSALPKLVYLPLLLLKCLLRLLIGQLGQGRD